MAKKKRNPDDQPEEPTGSGPKPNPKPVPEPEARRSRPKARPKARSRRPAPSRLPDAREIEMAMWEMLGKAAPDESPESPRGRASELLKDAFRATEPARVVKLARRALEIWPDCADAYVLLAEHARSPKEALDYYEKGVEAGARDIGEAAFRKAVGYFWSMLPSRPYMRARLGQAQVLWILGRRAEALAHYKELLTLNPNDNQGVRYLLAAALLETGHDDDLASLLMRYEEDAAACWAY
ncbi:MAG: tetratricopeptide repeat protein, partial [Isosphaeraceae bacterium]